MFDIAIPSRSSDAIDCIVANPFTGVVSIEYTRGSIYTYENVSRRAILNLIANPNMSLGFWVNNNVLATQYNKFVYCA